MIPSSEDLSFLQFFLTEPIYLLPEPEPVIFKKKIPVEETEAVSEPENPTVEDSEALPSALFLPETEGGNREGVLVLFYDKESKTLRADCRQLLEKILNAIHLTFEDVALCNWALLEEAFEQQKNIFESIQKIKSDKILVFGDLPLAWSLSHFFQKYHITQETEGKKLLLADDLQKIAQNRELKIQLWNSLQSMFQ